MSLIFYSYLPTMEFTSRAGNSVLCILHIKEHALDRTLVDIYQLNMHANSSWVIKKVDQGKTTTLMFWIYVRKNYWSLLRWTTKRSECPFCNSKAGSSMIFSHSDFRRTHVSLSVSTAPGRVHAAALEDTADGPCNGGQPARPRPIAAPPVIEPTFADTIFLLRLIPDGPGFALWVISKMTLTFHCFRHNDPLSVSLFQHSSRLL